MMQIMHNLYKCSFFVLKGRMGHNVNILPNVRTRGRGTAGVPKSRFDIQTRDWLDDGWEIEKRRKFCAPL